MTGGITRILAGRVAVAHSCHSSALGQCRLPSSRSIVVFHVSAGIFVSLLTLGNDENAHKDLEEFGFKSSRFRR